MIRQRATFPYLPALLLVTLLGTSAWLLTQQGYTPLALLQTSQQTLTNHPWLMLLAFVLRPLILFPVSLMVISTGALLGLPWALLVAWVGHSLSALSAYALVRWLAPRSPTAETTGRLQRWRQQAHRQGFQAVLLMRVTLVPFDLANFSCAWLRVPVRTYLVATAIGIIPSNLAMASFGASLKMEQLLQGHAQLPWQQLVNVQQLLLSAVLVSVSVLLARHLKHRSQRHAATG